MCMDPISGLLTVGSGLMQYQGQKQQAAAYEAQARADEQNAKVVENQREQLNKQNLADLEKTKAKRDIIAGQNRAAFGAAGISNSSGTGLDLLAANYGAYNEDKESLHYNLQNDDYGKRVEHANYMDSAANARASAKSAKNPCGTILGTAASLYKLNQEWAGKKKVSLDNSANYGLAASNAVNVAANIGFGRKS